MKKLLSRSTGWTALLASAAWLTLAFSSGDPLPIGSTLPKADLKLKDISGMEIAIKDIKKDNGILVMFSCNTCPYVIKNQSRTVAVGNYAKKNNVGFIVLNSNEAQRDDADSYEAMKNYAKEQHYDWNYVIDKNNEVADAFGANRTPECFLFDKNLKLVYHGAIDDNPSDPGSVTRNHLTIAIDELVAGKDISIKESRSVGCTIKRKG
jgi:hypothetical protein